MQECDGRQKLQGQTYIDIEISSDVDLLKELFSVGQIGCFMSFH